MHWFDINDILRWLDEFGHRPEIEDTHLRIKEAGLRSLEEFCKATESRLDPVELRVCTEAYILERFDHVASVFLARVTDLQDLDQYEKTLYRWCSEILPTIERGFNVRAG